MNIDKYKISKELRDYAIWGVIAAFVNVGVFQILLLCDVDYKIANITALIFNRFFCYFTNKYFVFRTKCENATATIKEMISFFMARMVSFFIDYFGVIIMVEYIKMNELVSKLIVAFVVILTNYTFSKFVVFKKNNINEEEK